MPTVDSNFFEIQRRGSQWSKNSTLDDQVTPMGWDADPNGAISGRTAGETKLVAMLIGANFVISNGDIWWKTAMPNTWTKQGSGTGGSGDTSYLHTQSTPAATWNINHNLGKYPAVNMMDLSNNVMYGDITHIDTNNTVITLSGSMSGKASLT